MSSPGSVSHWIGQLKAGNPTAAQKLWAGYFQRLVNLARKKLRGRPRRAADEEDVALSAFDSFCRGAENGRFPRLGGRDGLWRLLVVITARKVAHLVRDEGRHKRGGGAVLGESALLGVGNGSEGDLGLEQIIGREPTPAFAAQVAEEYERLLARLEDPELRSIAVSRMEGYTGEEIAERLGYAACTIERRLRLIRSIWEQEIAP